MNGIYQVEGVVLVDDDDSSDDENQLELENPPETGRTQYQTYLGNDEEEELEVFADDIQGKVSTPLSLIDAMTAEVDNVQSSTVAVIDFDLNVGKAASFSALNSTKPSKESSRVVKSTSTPNAATSTG